MPSKRFEIVTGRVPALWAPSREAERTLLIERVRGRYAVSVRISTVGFREASLEQEIHLGSLLFHLGITLEDCQRALEQPAGVGPDREE